MGKRRVRIPTSLGVMLHSYRTLPYKWRHAIGELIDNSVDSYLQHKEKLPKGIDIRISYDGKGAKKTLIIQDNAYGMDEEGIESAVQITRRHGSNYYSGGIGKYGLGLKKSATSLGDKWSVVTRNKESDTKYTVKVDVFKLYENDATEVEILDSKSKTKHGTRIEIELRNYMRGALEKNVKNHIAEMYRFYLEDGDIRIYWNDELLEYEQPETRLLEDGPVWSSIDLPVKVRGKKQQTVIVKGEIYVLQTMSHTHSGIQLFHNRRMIIGGSGKPNENWRPTELLGNYEGYRARLFCGHFHLDELEVNHQKDGFLWGMPFDQQDLLEALQNSPLVESYVDEARQASGSADSNSGVKTTVESTKGRMGSKSVQDAVGRERSTAGVPADELTGPQVEAMATEAGTTDIPGNLEPKRSYSTVEQPAFWPIMTSKVTGQVSGRDRLRILINEGHPYYQRAIMGDVAKEVWVDMIDSLALTDYILTRDGEENPSFSKIVKTLSELLAAQRSGDD